MKVRWIIIPFSALMAAGGGYLGYIANMAPRTVPGMAPGEPRHPVTAEMSKNADGMAKTVAPFFKLPDTDGKLTLMGGKGPKPQFIYFIKEGCPCSIDGEPLMQNLAKHFKGRIEFVSVTDADAKKAQKWEFEMRVPYPLVSNPTLEVMHGYKATGSLMSALINTDGTIVKYWPGYSKSMMEDMNAQMANVLHEPVRAFDTQYAPVKRTTGCAFAPYAG